MRGRTHSPRRRQVKIANTDQAVAKVGTVFEHHAFLLAGAAICWQAGAGFSAIRMKLLWVASHKVLARTPDFTSCPPIP